jgi:tetratricopeptide (TPR) repeat protein
MKPTIYFIVFIGFFFFQTIPAAPENRKNTDIDAGIELFKYGQIEQSYDLLLNAFDDYPDHVALNFYLGRAAFELGRYETAIMAFERVLIVSPFEHRVKLEIARAFHAMGANNTARKYCLDVLASDPPEAVKNNINLFLAVIDKSEQTHFLNGQLAVGTDWNNNIWATPSSTNISTIIGNIDLSGESSTKTQDWIYNATLNLSHHYRPLYTPISWKTDATFYKSLYNTTPSLDLQYAGGSTGPEWQFEKAGYGVKAELAVVELGNSQYLKSMGFSATARYAFSPAILSTYGYRFSSKDFPGISKKDADTHSVFLNLNAPIFSAWASAGLLLEQENAADDEYSYQRIQTDLSVSKHLRPDLQVTGRYGFQHSTYKAAGELFSDKRKDSQHMLGVSLKKTIWQHHSSRNHHLDIRINYQHTWAFSNIDLYEYSQDIVQAALIYYF